MSLKADRLSQISRNAKRFGRAAETALRKIDAAEKEIATNREKVDRYFSDTFCWAFLYELPYVQLLILLMSAHGILEEFAESIRGAENP